MQIQYTLMKIYWKICVCTFVRNSWLPYHYWSLHWKNFCNKWQDGNTCINSVIVFNWMQQFNSSDIIFSSSANEGGCEAKYFLADKLTEQLALLVSFKTKIIISNNISNGVFANATILFSASANLNIHNWIQHLKKMKKRKY